MKTFHLIRHAQSESNAGQAIRPNHQIALTEFGKTQAIQLANWLATNIPTPKQVFVSPYIRTQQTAEPYLQKIGQTAIIIDELREFNYLDYEQIKHLDYANIKKLAYAYWESADMNYRNSPKTDNFIHLIEQVKIARDKFAKLPDGHYVVFTHGMWLVMLAWQLMHNYQGGHCSRVFHMTKFRAFELAITPKNCEVFAYHHYKTFETIGKIKIRNSETAL